MPYLSNFALLFKPVWSPCPPRESKSFSVYSKVHMSDSQAMFEQAAASYPGAFSGYKLRVIESHQSTKKVRRAHGSCTYSNNRCVVVVPAQTTTPTTCIACLARSHIFIFGPQHG
eukprot:scaffold22513_cov18-Tisochrysis_lutea.AAC.1